VMLSVTDTGIGMDQTTLSRIFEPFFTTKPPGEGTGLGLSIVYGVVKQSGGTIWVYSEPNRGTSFKIYLPRVEGSAQSIVRRPEERVVYRGWETVLVVEDDSALRQLTCTLLEGAGYRVLQAESGETAIAMAKGYSDTIHLLLTDIIMPGMSGVELAAAIKDA